ncbi:hypothetical protein D2V17_16730 [Aurantiacibacter xanthus]|uniref:Uncharacterized protein n=1 Tax=Aurantiacibacter xanthus TaxID=1784712 RepID=A0A3A1P4U2_9SPHN|nr:hypothetical protein [Aurantiacibacter xanthus]RIV81781.1 hypothetical protein D2V17_16730 [Aurantiacibacter xanthus]
MTAYTAYIAKNRRRSREVRDCITALLFEAAESADEWWRYDLSNAIRAIAMDFDRDGGIKTAPNRRAPGQPSQFVANRLRARVDMGNYHPRTGSVR